MGRNVSKLAVIVYVMYVVFIAFFTFKKNIHKNKISTAVHLKFQLFRKLSHITLYIYWVL